MSLLSLTASTEVNSTFENASDYELQFKDSWTWGTPLLILGNPNLTECITYTAPMKYTGGLDSEVMQKKKWGYIIIWSNMLFPNPKLIVYMDGTQADFITVYIHPPEQRVLTTTSLYGTTSFCKISTFKLNSKL